ncbi:MAG: type I restriction-modification system subunit M [Brevinema sp.]
MSKEQAIALGKVLWEIANKLRGAMDADQFRDYMLGFIFFKYLSENFEEYSRQQLGNMSIQELYTNHPQRIKQFEERCKTNIGYVIPPNHLWRNFSEKAVNNQNDLLDDLATALREIESSTIGRESADDMGGLFSDLDLNSVKIGRNYNERNKLICSIITTLETKLDMHDLDRDDLGDAYEYLIGEFAASSGRKAGEFYTPQRVSTILSKLVTLDFNGKNVGIKKKIDSIYDPTCGSGSLLFNVYKEVTKHGGEVSHIHGQEKNLTTYNLARMNLLLHQIPFSKFHVHHGDTLTAPQLEKKAKMEVIVANPPFSLKWDPATVVNDDRFKGYALPPASTADFAFVLHMINHLADNGTCAVVVPHGVLFRSGAEQKIRETLLNAEGRGYLDAVIGLPSNLFYSTGIPVCILVFKKCRINEDILFIDASKHFEKEKKQNVLTDQHIENIISCYAQRKDSEKFSRKVSLEEIKENGYNLNIPRYVDSSEAEEVLDLSEIVRRIKETDAKLAENYVKIKKYTQELGVECW